MRIISGTKRGLRLVAAKGAAVRPTTDSVKELIFDVLGKAVVHGRVLDLYAGTGALGIEALSRGAARAVFVENSRAALRAIQENLKKAGFEDRAEILRLSALHGVKMLANLNERFDIILADPPYRAGLAEKTLVAVENADLVAPGGWVVLEQRVDSSAGAVQIRYGLHTRKRRGDTEIFFYRYDADT